MADPRLPIPAGRFAIPRTGHYGDVRRSPKDGGCGTHGYPCMHRGVDLAAPASTEVVAPHDGWILAAVMAPKGQPLPAPFVGYEPGVVLIAHDDIAAESWWRRHGGLGKNIVQWIKDLGTDGPQSARYSLLGHVVTPLQIELDSRVWKPEDRSSWREASDGTLVAVFKPHGDRATVADGGKYVHAGDVVGYVSPTARHVHWELRIRPLAEGAQRIDPFAAFAQLYGLAVPASAGSSSGDCGMLLLLAALAYASGKRR